MMRMARVMSFSRIFANRRVWIALVAIAVLTALHLSELGQYLSLETIKSHRENLTEFVARHLLCAAAVYVAIYIFAVAFSIPGAVFLTLSGGFLFGAFLGTGLTVVAATAGAILVFLFARSLMGKHALDRFGDSAQRIAIGIRRNAVAYLLVLRLVPLFPFFLVNLVPAFVGVRLSIFAVTTLFGIVPATAVFSLAGSGLGSLLDKGETLSIGSILTLEIVGGLVALALLSLLSIPARSWLAREAGRNR
jgi:uncharacterized membrane protein YdjX (TVP38/TMEM64 family)